MKVNACIENVKMFINQCVSKIVIHNLKQFQILNKRFTKFLDNSHQKPLKD